MQVKHIKSLIVLVCPNVNTCKQVACGQKNLSFFSFLCVCKFKSSLIFYFLVVCDVLLAITV